MNLLTSRIKGNNVVLRSENPDQTLHAFLQGLDATLTRSSGVQEKHAAIVVSRSVRGILDEGNANTVSAAIVRIV